MPNTPRERIQTLLRLHGGHCFIVACCDDFEALTVAAREMESEGLYVVTDGHNEVAGLDIKRKGYRPKRAGVGEHEEPAH